MREVRPGHEVIHRGPLGPGVVGDVVPERAVLVVPHVLGVRPEGAEVVVLVVAPRRKALEELAFEARDKPGKSGYAIASPSHS